MAKTGQDIESICGKCGDVWHVVVAMVGNQVARVICKECGAEHRYRPPKKAKAAGAKAAAAKPASPRASSNNPSDPPKAPRASRASKRPSDPPGPKVAIDRSKPARTYRPFETFSAGESLQHLQFGVGVVEQTDGTKCIVWFPGGRKTLVMGRSGGPAPLPDRKPQNFGGGGTED